MNYLQSTVISRMLCVFSVVRVDMVSIMADDGNNTELMCESVCVCDLFSAL